MDNQSPMGRRRVERLSAAIIAACMVVLIISVDQLAREKRQPLAVEELPLPIAVFPDFASVSSIDVKKQQFFDYLQDYIDAENQRISVVRRELQSLADIVNGGVALSTRELERVLLLSDVYRLPDSVSRDVQLVDELLLRVDQIPASLVLAQAANESAWGTSRFALEGNNIFGQWCYEEGCGMIPLQRVSGASHEVQRFDSLEHSVQGYFANINSHPLYEYFRELRAYMRNRGEDLDPMILAYGLGRYSQRGENYVDEVQTLIEQNNVRSRDKN